MIALCTVIYFIADKDFLCDFGSDPNILKPGFNSFSLEQYRVFSNGCNGVVVSIEVCGTSGSGSIPDCGPFLEPNSFIIQKPFFEVGF